MTFVRPGDLLTWAIMAVVLVMIAQNPQPLEVAVFAVLALVMIRSMVRYWTAERPVLIDEPGITFSDLDDGSGSRFVPWGLITEVVLFEIPSTRTTSRRWQPAIGVRLVGHPDGVSVHRPLAGWSLDRAALERAVTRFGGDVEVVDGVRAGAEPTAAELDAEMRRVVTESVREALESETPAGRPGQPGLPEQPGQPGQPAEGSRPRFVWHRTARYQPIDPGAYLARFDLRSNLGPIVFLLGAQVFLWAVVVPQGGAVGVVFAVIFALPLLLFWRGLRSGGAVALAIDSPGVFFGESTSSGDDQEHRLVPWADVTAVVVYDQLVDGSKQDKWKRAVGVRLRGGPSLVRHWRIVDGWQLDRPALEAAVARFAPAVPVLDGSPQRPPGAIGVMQALLETGQEIYRDEQDRRREG